MSENSVGRREARSLVWWVSSLALAFVFALVGAPAASAAPAKVTKVFGGPITTGGACNPDASATKTDASSYTDFCVAFRVENDEGPAGDDLKSQVIDTPQGFAGIADGYPQCTDAQFNKASESNAACPADTQMGQVAAKIRAKTSISTGIPLGEIGPDGTATLAPTGAVFNLEHGPNEVARLGIDLRPTALSGSIDQPNVKIIVRVTLRPSPDVGLRSIIDDMPNTAHVSIPFLFIDEQDPLAVDEFNLVFWGPQRGTMPRSFGFLGSDCTDTQETKLSAVTYGGAASSAQSPTYQLTNCDNPAIQFKPGLKVTTSENRPDVTAETAVSVTFGDSTDPAYIAGGVRKTVVTLPEGLSFSGQIASGPNGLPLCTPEQFGQFRAEHSSCPAATAVGTVSFKSPTQTRLLKGDVFLGSQPAPGELPDIYIEAEEGPATDAPRVKLRGSLTTDSRNRIVTTLDDLPEVPVTEFLLTFRGGDHAAVVTPPRCGTTEGALAAFPYRSPSTPTEFTTEYSVTDDCGGVPFDPSVVFTSANPTAGASANFITTIARADRSARFARTVIDLPPGALANLKGVPECSQAAAAANQCAAATRVGTVLSFAGVGPAPYRAVGTIYLTDRSPGAVAGVALTVPVQFGEVNLGTLVVQARIDIRPGDLGLRLTADVPQRFKGIPLNIRSISVGLDRPGFALNPTNCNPLRTTSGLIADDGTLKTVTAGFQVSGCGALPFAPSIDAAVTGATSRLGRPDVAVRVQNVAGASALGKTYVTLPKGLGVDLAQVPRGCDVGEFTAGGCPTTSIIGAVSGALAIADEPLRGDLYLLKAAPGKTLPGIGLSFTGRFAGRVAGTTAISKTGQLVTQFDALPDLPLTDLQIDIKGGTGGPLIATEKLCDAESVDFDATFVAQSGPTRRQTAKTYCGTPLGAALPKVKARLGGVRKGKPTLVMTVDAPQGKKIKQFDVRVPSGYKLSKSRAKSRRYVALKKLTVKGKVKSKRVSSTKLRVTLPTNGTTRAQLLTRTGAMSIKRKSVRRSKKKVTVQLTVTYVGGAKMTVPVRLTPR